MDPNGMAQVGNGFIDPTAMAAMIQGQQFIPDPSMAGMQMPDAQVMMPLMLANGHASAPQQPNNISAGKTIHGILTGLSYESESPLLLWIRTMTDCSK